MKRRTFLKRGLTGAGILVGASGVYLGARSNPHRAKPVRPLSVLDEASFAVVAAFAERTLMFPSARPIDVAHRIDQALLYAGPEAQHELRLMLAILESSLAGIFLRGSARLFTELTIEERVEAVDRWGGSKLSLLRGVANSIRKLCIANHYAFLEAAREIGYVGPVFEKPDPGAIVENQRLSDARQGVIEGQTITEDQEMSADVCIIGSGAGGAVAASILQGAGQQVIVLDEGGYFTQSRFRMREDECYPHLYQESALRATKDLSIAIFQGRAVGGTTVVNWTTSYRTPEHVLELWKKRFSVNIEPAALEPHYAAVEERLSIAEIPFEQINRNNRLLWDGCQALGYHVHLLKRNVKNCAHTGFCGYGCPIDAKQSMLVTYLPDAMEKGATCVSRARVDRLLFEGNRVSGLEASFLDALGISPTGRKLKVKAKRFVLSSGAIGSPAVLLRSGAPDPNDRLGRRTFLHPAAAVLGNYGEPVHGWQGAPQGVASHHFAQRRENEIGYFLEAAPVQPLLMSIALPGFGVEHRELMMRLPGFAAWVGLAIDGHAEGDEGGRVEIRDSGWPLLDYPISDRLWSTLRDAQRTLAKVHLAAGAKEVFMLHAQGSTITSEKDLVAIDRAEYAPSRVPIFSAHVMGGCGMSDDAKLGVVRSEDLRHHQIENLHVIDGSVFPTSTGVNPQESIYGLAHLIATRIASVSA